MEWKFRRKSALMLGCMILVTLSQMALIQGACNELPDFPKFPDMSSIFSRSLLDVRYGQMFEEISSENEMCECNKKYMDDGLLRTFNEELDGNPACLIDVEATCRDTTVIPTTMPETTLPPTTELGTTAPGVFTTEGEADRTTSRGGTTESSTPPSQGETKSSVPAITLPRGHSSTQSSPLPVPPVTESTTGDETVTSFTTSEVTIGEVLPPILPNTQKSSGPSTALYAGVAAGVVFVLVVVVALIFFCRSRSSALTGVLDSRAKHDRLQRQRSDCQPMSADQLDDTYSEPPSPDPQLNGTLGRANGHIGNGKNHVEHVSFVPLTENKKKDYVILREDSTNSANDFHFNTLKAMELPHALQHGDFGETSTDQTLPRNKDRMAETSLTMDPNFNTFKGSKKKRNGSDSGVEVSPTLQNKAPTETMRSKPGIGYVTYENPCIRDDEVDNKSTRTADTRSVCTIDSNDAELREWEDWVANDFNKNPEVAEEDDLISAKNARLFFPPTPDGSPPRTKQNSLCEDEPVPDKKAESDINSNNIYPHIYDNNAMVGSNTYLHQLPDSTPTATDSAPHAYDNKAMVGSNSYVKKLPNSKPVAQIEPLLQNGLPVSPKATVTRQPPVVPHTEYSPPQSVPPSNTTSNSSLNKVGVVAPPPEFSDNQQDSVFPETETAVSVHPAKPAKVRTPLAEVDEDDETGGIKPRRLSVKDLKAQFETQGPDSDHQSTLSKYGSKPRSQSTRQEMPAVATLPRGKPGVKTFPGKAHVWGKQPLDPIPSAEDSLPPNSAPAGGRSNYLWADKQSNGPSA